MRIREVSNGMAVKDVYRGSVPVYKGPTSDFPYTAYKILGSAHLAFGIAIMIVGIVHATLSYEDRKYFLLSGSVAIWCPLFALAVGVLGVCVSKKRYWEIECMKSGFIVASMLTGVAMVVLIIVTILIDFYYYDIIDLQPEEMFEVVRKRFSDNQEQDGYITLLSLIVAFAACELIIANVGVVVACCCSPIYEPDKGQGFQLINRPKPVEQVQIMEKKPVMGSGSQLMMQGSQPTHVIQPVQIIENPAPQMAAPSLMYVPSTMSRY